MLTEPQSAAPAAFTGEPASLFLDAEAEGSPNPLAWKREAFALGSPCEEIAVEGV